MRIANIPRLAIGTILGVGLGAFVGKNYDDFLDFFPHFNIRAASPGQPEGQAKTLTNVEPSIPAVSKPSFSTPPSRASEIMRFGYPSFDTLRTFEDYVLSYDRRNRIANWVVEHLTPERMIYEKGVDRKKCEFADDKSIHLFFRSTKEDYYRSGYDRGHMAAAANHRKSQVAIGQTFLLSNMAPQVGFGFNRGKWNELEKRVRALARKSRNVYVCTGPLFLPRQDIDGKLYVKYEVIGKNNVAVPTHFFKVILIDHGDGGYGLESYLMPNSHISDETPLESFHTPLDGLERAAGFLIFENMPKNLLRTMNRKRIA